MLLVNSGNDDGIGGNANSQAYPPLGIVSLGSALREAFGDRVEVTLADGQVDSMPVLESLIETARPELVGISMYCTSTRNTIRLAVTAKENGATTLLGNDHAAMHCDTILRRVPEIDYICTADVGEPAVVSLVSYLKRQSPLEHVVDMAWRDGSKVRHSASSANKAGRSALDALPIPERATLPRRYWQHYLDAFKAQRRKVFSAASTTGVATINRARGCARAKKRCSYCGIADLVPRGSSSDVFWRDVRAARTDVDATVLYEAFDSASSWPSLLAQWSRGRPSDLADTRFLMYAQAAETTRETVSVFSELGVFCVNMGLDSGDDKALKLLKGPHDSVDVNRMAARLWSEAGIEIHTSFVLVGLGSESETRRSLDRTLRFAEWLAQSTTTVSLDSALLYPDKAAPIGGWLFSPERAATESAALGWTFIDLEELARTATRWRDEVFLDPVELCADFARICGTSADVLLEYDAEIRRISERWHLNYGRSQGGPE